MAGRGSQILGLRPARRFGLARLDGAPAIEIAGVTKSLGGHRVLDAIDLAIAPGSFVALIGPSGAGKTTLLKLINRLVEPDAGQVTVNGVDNASLPIERLRRDIGYVIQGVGLFPHMSVADNIWIVPRLGGVKSDEKSSRVSELLRLVALPEDMASRFPRSLSGGQAQRVGVARALAASPAIMLMDEPFGALDPATRDELGRAYRDLHDKLSLTTVMVTHDVGEALLLADRIIMLREGRIVADGKPVDLVTGHPDPAVRAMIDVPKRQAERLAALGTGQ